MGMIGKRQVVYDMERCISNVPGACFDCSHYTGKVGYECMVKLMSDALALLKEQEPRRGRWIDMGDFEQCSVCTGTHLKEFQSYYGKATWVKTQYCPWCGADMREGGETDG